MSNTEAEGRPQTSRSMQIALIKSRIERDEYEVDPRAVAAAILAKLLARQKACS